MHGEVLSFPAKTILNFEKAKMKRNNFANVVANRFIWRLLLLRWWYNCRFEQGTEIQALIFLQDAIRS